MSPPCYILKPNIDIKLSKKNTSKGLTLEYKMVLIKGKELGWRAGWTWPLIFRPYLLQTKSYV